MNNKNLLISLAALIVGGGALYLAFANKGVDATRETTQDDTTPDTTQPAVTTTRYKDGTYMSSATYQTPGSTETITVTLTLKDDRVTDAIVSFKRPAGVATSERFQDLFAANFKQQVIGKDLATLELTHVSGSSLSPKGFNKAVETIRTEAAAAA